MNDIRADIRVALLIDADNLSGDVMGQAIEHLLKLYGAIDFRRAYCSAQKVIEHLELFRRYSIRPMVNIPTGKNSTDIALAVDAIDLAICERPGVMVIASSDSDYAALAQRLREKGCKVLGIGQAGKTGAEAPLAYDKFIDLRHRKTAPSGGAPVSAVPARSRSRSRVAPVASAQPPRAAPDEVAMILRAMPVLESGAAVQLNEVGEALRRGDILKSKRASPSRFLKRYAEHFELAPSDKSQTVRYLGPSI
jgi:NYN domain